MVGMMLPSAAPAVLIFARVARSGPAPDRPVLRTYLFAAGYLLVLDRVQRRARPRCRPGSRAPRCVTPMMESATPYLAAAVLLRRRPVPVEPHEARLPRALPHARRLDRRELARRARSARCAWASRTASTAWAAAGR